jgi:hypothetical protein
MRLHVQGSLGRPSVQEDLYPRSIGITSAVESRVSSLETDRTSLTIVSGFPMRTGKSSFTTVRISSFHHGAHLLNSPAGSNKPKKSDLLQYDAVLTIYSVGVLAATSAINFKLYHLLDHGA